MENQAPYGVSYIASAPEELKVGDRVEVVYADVHRAFYVGRKGFIVENPNPTNGYLRVSLIPSGDAFESSIDFKSEWLRKLPDTISFEDSFVSAHGKDNPMDRQVGGSHYKDMAIQPVEFCMKNKLDFCTSSAIKYLCRHKNKNGKEDLLKAKHFIDLLIQLEYPDPDFENVE